ncbi:flagellar motor protein MotB [Polaribacter sp. Hel1_85]|uniref:OmpA/MotB family protein n=1 Tax=Polaribacter sp. Hel1_85 TaxID=1250005 RepID=UPI00052CF515|nr:OmpA family protein [Polaribacter sp. Hel1_85]KGL63273.1 cell envelope biogenesis protein OmpA [Polaribacter sp. Hel1_85]
MKNLIYPLSIIILISTSCVSKKKYAALETKYSDTKTSLNDIKLKFAKIDKRVQIYNDKINSLRGDNITLERENKLKLDFVDGKAVVSEQTRTLMNKTLAKMDPKKLANAKTLKDSLNLAVSYNVVRKALGKSEFKDSEDININIEETVVMISVSDKLLFNSGSYQVKNSALKLITKLADIIQSEPSIDVMIEGHADSKTIKNESVKDNWDLSVKRATSIVRLLQNKFDIEGSRLIASGRGDTMPLYPNTSNENRAKNRRTKIIILPNLNKFFALLTEEGVIEK